MSSLTLYTHPMAAVMAFGHPLTQHDEVNVADILDMASPEGNTASPGWNVFWTPAQPTGVSGACTGTRAYGHELLELVAAGHAVATLPLALAECIAHPGILVVPLADGRMIETCLVWRAENDRGIIAALVDLARAWSPLTREQCSRPLRQEAAGTLRYATTSAIPSDHHVRWNK